MQPNVFMYANADADTDADAVWTLLASGDKIVWCGVGGSAGMADTAIPNKQRPTSGTEAVDEMWVGTTTSYVNVPLYGATGTPPETPKGNIRVMMVTWDNAIATNPRITCYDASARTATSNILAGTTDTFDSGRGTNASYIKARWSKSVNATWCDATTGFIGAKVIGITAISDAGENLSQSLQGDTQYLENDLTTTGFSDTAYGHVNGEHCFSDNTDGGKLYTYDLKARFPASSDLTGLQGRFTVFDILCWTGANLPPGTYADKLSFRYTWV